MNARVFVLLGIIASVAWLLLLWRSARNHRPRIVEISSPIIIMTEQSCKFDINGFDPFRILVGTNRPRTLVILDVLGTPTALKTFAKKLNFNPAEVIVGIRNDTVRKVYMTRWNRLSIDAAEIMTDGTLQICEYVERRSIRLERFGEDVMRTFATLNGNSGHLRLENDIVTAVHMRSNGMIVRDTLSMAAAWLQRDFTSSERKWIERNGSRLVTYLSFGLQKRTVTIYHSTMSSTRSEKSLQPLSRM